jgi:hypothetical protein
MIKNRVKLGSSDQLFQNTLVINKLGGAGPKGWAGDRIFTQIKGR